ncbi:membrane protein [Bacillus sp. OxB-1]|uniref:DUF2339 domain-containing protein n=1 Tax=Bacillus sp. (strain OxB-1) TaxID=98228 RepID=UPI000581D224|nr:DUF2339 domain-containing protein [Bacillus sp. OxB-1]BAQ09066.1 membrane protein [Bacillus sp. OxB-1]
MQDDMQSVVERVAHLEAEVASLKQELAGLRSQASLAPARPATPSQPAEIPKPIPKTGFRTIRPKEPAEPDQPRRPKPEPKPKPEFNLEQALGIWLPRVFMFILLLGLLWGLKVGMDYGVITNPVRIALGYGGTVLLYYLGMRFIRNGKTGFGLTLLGGFLALGILTTFAAHHLYGYFSFAVAFVVGVAYIAAGLWMSQKMRSETLTIFSALAGFLLPFLLEGEGATAVQFCLYILLLFLSLFYVSLSQKHKYTFYVTFLLFHLTLLIYGILDGTYGDETILVGTVMIQHLALLSFYVRGRVSRHVFTEALLYTNFVFSIGWIKLLPHTEEVAVYGLLALLYIVLAGMMFRKQDDLLQGVLSAVAVFAVSVFILSFRMEQYPVRLMLLLVNGAIGIWVGLRFRTLRTVVTGSLVYGWVALTILGMLPLQEFISLEHGVWLVFLGSLLWIYHSLYRFPPARLDGKLILLDRSLIFGQLVFLFYLYQLVHLWTIQSSLSHATATHVQYLVFIGVFLVMSGFHKWKHGLYLTHAAVFGFLLIGLFLLPMGLAYSFEDGGFLFNLVVQILFVVLLTAMIRAILTDTFYVKREALRLKASGLAVVMQILYFLFLNKWYFAWVDRYSWDSEFVLLVHTFLLFAFAFLSVSIGRKLDWRQVKVLGVVLIGLCILKLFFVDLAAISIMIRAILFIVVGIVGLVYSRTLLKE